MTRFVRWLFVILVGAGAGLRLEAANVEEPSWLAPSIGPLQPFVHAFGAVGDSSADAEELAVGHHDPTREDGTVQAIEMGASLRLNQLEGFATYNLMYAAEEEWETEWEEAFLKLVDLPGGFEVRGGRMLGRFGQHNARHLHAWDFVDTPLVLGRFLGDHGLWFDGGDITWLKQDVEVTYGLTVAYGEAIGHGHGEHGEEDHGEEEHSEEEHEEGHGDEHAGEIAFDDGVGSARFFTQRRLTDYRSYESGLSMAVGDDEGGRRIVVGGLDFAYRWRENGLQPGGRAYTWTTEFLYRDVEEGAAHSDHEEEGEHDGEEHAEEHADEHEEEHEGEYLDEEMLGGGEYGAYTEFVYTVNQALDLGTRLGYVEGNDELGSDERFQASPAVTTYLDPYRRVALRGQYNYDDVADGSEEHTFWVQLGLSWGGPEVR